jgi:hypothetical protein
LGTPVLVWVPVPKQLGTPEDLFWWKFFTILAPFLNFERGIFCCKFPVFKKKTNSPTLLP